jgi:hypothetical protein
MQNFPMHKGADGRDTRTPQQELARAELLHRTFPNNKIEQAPLDAAKDVAALERRAGLIAQLHKQAIAGADDPPAWQKTLTAPIEKDAQRRKATAWLFAGTVSFVALACVVALFWL